MEKIEITKNESEKLFKIHEQIYNRIRFLAHLINNKEKHIDQIMIYAVNDIKELSIQIYHLEEYFKIRNNIKI